MTGRGEAGGVAPAATPREVARSATMSQARSHLRGAFFLAAVSLRGATTQVAARRELSARPALQKPGMEYQVSRRQACGRAMTRGPGLKHTASGSVSRGGYRGT